MIALRLVAGGVRGDRARAGPAASLHERLPSGLLTGPFATGPVREAAAPMAGCGRGKGLEAVFAEGGEVDRQVDRAKDPLAEARAVVVS